jgi:hypothetical protein
MRMPGAWRFERAADTVRLASDVTRAYRSFLRTGTTNSRAYQAMRELSWRTNGRYNDFMAALSSLSHPPLKLHAASGVLGDLDSRSIELIADHIRRDGYCVFDRKLPEKTQQTLMELATHVPCKPLVIPEDDSFTKFEYRWLPDCLYDRNNLVSALYSFDLQTIAEQSLVQELLTDETILGVASAYLGVEPIIKQSMSMWWSTDYLHGKPSSLAAQHFHFDLDGIKFLKFFFHLTDVGSKSGPHCYVRGSHRRKPRALLRDGRISDEEILQHYSADQIVEITGDRGTIFAADTRGFHKGKAIQSGERLMAQLEFATSLFGPEHQNIIVNDKFTREFRDFASRHPRVYSIYQRSGCKKNQMP